MNDISIALIEDHELTRIGLRAALHQQDGIRVIGEAATAAQGLRLLARTKPDVAIVDIGLPDQDGIELTRQFKGSQSDESSTRILILTMHEGEDSVLAAFAAGADSYCMKDINIGKLTEALRSTYEGNAWIDPTIANIVLRQLRQDLRTAQSSNGSTNGQSVTCLSPHINPHQLLINDPLTDRELEVLELIVGGCSNGDIASKLYITIGTVKTHVRSILNKLCADDRTQAAVLALRSGLVS